MQKKEYEKMHELESTNWWHFSKRNEISNLLVIHVRKNLKILDIGCGTGANGVLFSKNYGYFGIDSSKEAVNFSKTRLENISQMSSEKLSFKKNSFSCVLALDVLEHLKNEIKTLKQINKVLKKSGILIVSVPAFKELWSEHDELLHHYRRYYLNDLKDLLSSNGFEIIYSRYWNHLLFFPTFLLRFVKKLFKIKSNKSDLSTLPSFLNNFLIFYLNLETKLFKTIKLPFGTSAFIVAKKK